MTYVSRDYFIVPNDIKHMFNLEIDTKEKKTRTANKIG